jgi:thiaminase
MKEDWYALQMAMFPCLLGYGMIAKRLFDDPDTKRDGNTYFKWIENYVAEDFQSAVESGKSATSILDFLSKLTFGSND